MDRAVRRGHPRGPVPAGDVAAGGNYPIVKPGREWRALVMEVLLTAIMVSVILHTATGIRSIGHNAALAVGATVALLGLFASPISGASMEPLARWVPTSSPRTSPAGGYTSLATSPARASR